MKSDIIDELFRKYYNEALLYTLSLCRERAAAEDIVSSAFFKALESADGSIKDFKPWLFTVCRNEFLMLCRKQKHLADEDPSEDLPDDTGEAVDSIIRDESYRELYRAIARLPAAQKECIELFYFSGMKVAGIAAVTGKNEGSVKVTLHRAREALRKTLEEHDGF